MERSRRRTRNGSSSSAPWWKGCMRKYVLACLVCGGLSVCHGVVFIVIYLLLRSYTSSLHFFETIPTYVPGIVFIITGLILMCFAKRKHRYAFLLKMGGGCCLVCALLCIVMTVTTTVVHMNRLQTLHECVYTPQTCMCVSAIGDHTAQEAHRFVFNNTPNCEVVHGSLYSCLRAMFSFSVLGILLCIGCSMLLYQLSSHEKKRKYWEQLELRRRFLYQRHSQHGNCGCYDDLYPWQLWEMLDYRFLGEEETEQRQQQPQQSSGRNWLHWPRTQDNMPRQNFMSRLMSRETPSEEPPHCSVGQSDSVGSLPWRSECIHIFRPSSRNTHCFPPVRFGMRSRNSPYGRPPANHHRRTRSNDGIFHHLHMNATPGYAQSNYQFSGCEIPTYMWGPPPPYSQPSSQENVTLSRHSGLQQLEITRCSRVLEMEQGGNGSISSKMSTPLSERRFMCHNFSSDGITLTIGGNYDAIPPEHKKEDSCIVEVHVPYIIHRKKRIFNTLPTRSSRRRNSNPFKSLSNIPLGLSRRINSLRGTRKSSELSVIKASCDLLQGNSIVEVKPADNAFTVKQSFCDETDTLPNSTLVEVPPEFKSSLVIPTSPSPPDANNKVYAQSMPNLNASDSSLVCRVRRAPSSGNTSTSQDFADFDLEEDCSPFVLCSPVSDIPDDLSEGSTTYPPCHRSFRCEDIPFSNDSSSELPNSDSSSCGIIVIGRDDRGHLGTVHCRSSEVPLLPFSSSPSIILSKRTPSDCPINCNVRHLHHYHPDKGGEPHNSQERASNFVVTIKSVNV